MGADKFVYTASGNGEDLITDFSGQTAFGGGAGQNDKFEFDSILHGTFGYRGDLAFTASGNTEARVDSGQVLVDIEGDGTTNITIDVSGLISGSQLVAADFLIT